MRPLASLSTTTLAAVAEFNARLSPPILAAPPPSATAKCDARKCPWWPYSNSKDFKANTALILVVLVVGLICALAFNAAIRYIIRLHCAARRRQEGNADVEMKAANGGAAAENEVGAVEYERGMKLAGAEAECTICLSEFCDGEKIRVLEKCNHGFHVVCVQKWLALHSSCPTCRANCVEDSVTDQV